MAATSSPDTAGPGTFPAIGVRDSGVGGLTVARRIRQLLPHAPLLYFADTAHVPYGDRPPAEVCHYALSISEFLLGQGAQIVVFACNTSSAYALETARRRFTAPIVGMIEPGARSALATTDNGAIGVLATQATVDSGVYTRCLQALRPEVRCLEVACPAFVPLVENEQTASPAARRAAQNYLAPLLEAGVDTIILGCTHFPLLRPVLRELAPQLHLVDPAKAVAVEVAALARQFHGPPRDDTFFVSGPAEGVGHWITKLLPGTQPNLQSGPVFDLVC